MALATATAAPVAAADERELDDVVLGGMDVR